LEIWEHQIYKNFEFFCRPQRF